VSGTAHGHDALFFDSGRDLLDSAIGFANEALDNGELLAMACSAAHNRMFAHALDGHPGIVVLERGTIYQRAGGAIDFYQRLAGRAVRDGAPGVRVLGEVPVGDPLAQQHEWGRFEAVCNHALAALPLWSVCAYDVRTTPVAMLEMARVTHPHLRHGPRREDNPEYLPPEEYLLRDAGPPVLDLQATSPRVDVQVRSPGAVRHVRDQLRRSVSAHLVAHPDLRFPPWSSAEDLVLAVHEVLSNAFTHGEPPVKLRLWLDEQQAVCTVTDTGGGFDDPFAGYQRLGDRIGFWMTRQLCDDVTFHRGRDGFTVRLRSGLVR
jgi:anti-sigma regulatory factor (Ser/Thr protein kinase)